MWRDALVAELRTLEHPAWGPEHCERLWGLAEQIVESERIDLDLDVLFACVWLHDVGTFERFACDADSPPECAAQAAEQLLPTTGFPAEKIERVSAIVREHSFAGESRPTPEARVLRDADMLEFLGSVGLMRLLSLVWLEDWVPEPRAAIDLALQFADELPPRMFHETSRVMAEVRAEETLHYVEELSAATGSLAIL